MTFTTPFAKATCVVTGANRGIGLALTKALLQRGAKIYAGVRDVAGAEALHHLAKNSDGRLTVMALDISRDDSVQQFAQNLPRGPLDLLINNAGVNLDKSATVNDVAREVMLDTFNINTVGPLRVTQALLPHLNQSKAPKVANISSIMGSIAENGQGGAVAYRTSKTALNMVNKCLALANPRIVFLAMHPGWVHTDMGGAAAPVQTEQSASGLLSQIAAADATHSGTFVRYDGAKASW